jgi:hypothetical protein
MLTIGACILQPIPNGKEFTWPRYLKKVEQGRLPGNKARHEFEPEKPGGRVGD